MKLSFCQWAARLDIMPKSYTVKSGDTLNRISVKYYGTPQKWTDIVKANPQLAGRKLVYDGSPTIYPGDILIIPDETATESFAAMPVSETVSTALSSRRVSFTVRLPPG